VRASLRPIYVDLRRLAAVVAPPDVEPDDLVQAAVAQVLASGQWPKIHDHRGYLVRAMVRASPHLRGHILEPIGGEVTLVASYPPELGALDPTTRGLLYLVEVEEYLVDEAAGLIGCSTKDAERALTRVGTRPPRAAVEHVATRGEVRGVDAIVDAAVLDAAPLESSVVSRSRSWKAPVVVAIAAAVAVLGVLAFRARDHSTSPVAAPSSSPPAPPASFAATARGWVFDQGVVRDVAENRQVAAFPMKVALDQPVRVEGGFVAVLADNNLWFAKENSGESVQLDASVSGVAATPGGASIAYSVVAPDGLSATLKLVDVPTRAVTIQLPLDRFARVRGISNPEVVLDTGDGAAASAAIWDPTGSNRVTYLDAFGSVGGVGRNVAVLHEGDGTCGALVTVRNDAIAPLRNIDLSVGDHGCDPSRWEFDASGALVAGSGMIGAPAELRVSVNRFPMAIGQTRVVAAIWVDSSTVAAVDEHGHLLQCDVSARCRDVRLVRPPPITRGTVWLVAPRRDVADDRPSEVLPDAPPPKFLTAVQMLSPSLAFAAGPNQFLRSDDGGLTWRQMTPCDTPPPNQCTVNVEQLDMISDSHGWATTDQGLYVTTDGDRWLPVRSEGLEHRLVNVHFISTTEGWGIDGTVGEGDAAGVSGGHLVHTTNAGVTWSPLPEPNDAQAVCFTAPNDGWIAARDGVYRSVDGGSTWHLSYRSPAEELQSNAIVLLQCGGPRTAWVQFEPGGAAAGSSPYALVATTNGGDGWTTVVRSRLLNEIDGPDGPGSYPGPFSVIDPSTAVVIGNNPNGPATTAVLITNLDQQAPATAISSKLGPLAVSFADRDHGVVVGDGPADGGTPIYTTSDGGAHWSQASY